MLGGEAANTNYFDPTAVRTHNDECDYVIDWCLTPTLAGFQQYKQSNASTYFTVLYCKMKSQNSFTVFPLLYIL